MIRQAHTYLAGAVSGTALVAAAVVAFVLLVSLQALRDWPLAGIGGGGDSAVSDARPAPGPAGSGANGAVGGTAAALAARPATDAAAGGTVGPGRDRGGTVTPGDSPQPSTGIPGADTPVSSQPGGGGAADGAPSSSSSSGGKGDGGSGSPPQSSGGSGQGSSGQSTSGALTGTVNETVSGVDQTLGGALGETGVTEVTETAVNGLVGPESTVGKTVDKAVETVGGLLGGKR